MTSAPPIIRRDHPHKPGIVIQVVCFPPITKEEAQAAIDEHIAKEEGADGA